MMTTTQRSVLLLLASCSTTLVAEEMRGEALFQQLCAECHVSEGAPTKAPPMFAVVNHIKGSYPDREEFIERIVDWVWQPDASQSLMPGALRRFGPMPKLGYDAEQVRLIAEYLFDDGPPLPDWYVEHYRQMHGRDPIR
jgi:mono/diheme cytochrome c family protein